MPFLYKFCWRTLVKCVQNKQFWSFLQAMWQWNFMRYGVWSTSVITVLCNLSCLLFAHWWDSSLQSKHYSWKQLAYFWLFFLNIAVSNVLYYKSCYTASLLIASIVGWQTNIISNTFENPNFYSFYSDQVMYKHKSVFQFNLGKILTSYKLLLA